MIRSLRAAGMSVFHDEVEIEDFEYDADSDTYYYPCPCGDQFEITKVCVCVCNSVSKINHSACISVTTPTQDDLLAGEEIATCPSCSLIVRVIYDQVRTHTSALCT